MKEDKVLKLIIGIVLVLFTLPVLIMTIFMTGTGAWGNVCPMCGEEMIGHMGVGMWSIAVFWYLALIALLILGIYLIVQGVK